MENIIQDKINYTSIIDNISNFYFRKKYVSAQKYKLSDALISHLKSRNNNFYDTWHLY